MDLKSGTKIMKHRAKIPHFPTPPPPYTMLLWSQKLLRLSNPTLCQGRGETKQNKNGPKLLLSIFVPGYNCVKILNGDQWNYLNYHKWNSVHSTSQEFSQPPQSASDYRWESPTNIINVFVDAMYIIVYNYFTVSCHCICNNIENTINKNI